MSAVLAPPQAFPKRLWAVRAGFGVRAVSFAYRSGYLKNFYIICWIQINRTDHVNPLTANAGSNDIMEKLEKMP